RDGHVTGVQTCALPISLLSAARPILPNDLTRPGVASSRVVDPALPELIGRLRTAAGTLTTVAASLAGVLGPLVGIDAAPDDATRSEERRVGNGWRCWCA